MGVRVNVRGRVLELAHSGLSSWWHAATTAVRKRWPAPGPERVRAIRDALRLLAAAADDGHQVPNWGWDIDVIGLTKDEIQQVIRAVPPRWLPICENLRKCAATAPEYNRSITASTASVIYGSGDPEPARGRCRPWDGIEVVNVKGQAVVRWDDRRTTPIVVPDLWYHRWDVGYQTVVWQSVAATVDGGAIIFVEDYLSEHVVEQLRQLRAAAMAAISGRELPAVTSDNAQAIAAGLGGRVV